MSGGLSNAEARSLLELLGAASPRREGHALLDAAATQWGRGRLARCAREAANALREGRPLSQALAGRLPAAVLATLAAGERRGAPASGLERASELAARDARVGRLLVLPAAYPLAVLALCGLAAVLVAFFVAPPLQALQVELALLEGRPAPGGALAFAAAHPGVVAGAGALLAVLPLALPLGLLALSRSSAGARALLRLPAIASVLRWRASADFAPALADLIAAGVPHEEAWRLATRGVGPRALREALGAAEPLAVSGAPLREALLAAGLPAAAARALTPARTGRDGGVEALRELGEAASRRHELLLAAAGRGLAAAAGAAALVLSLSIVASVLLPLVAAGGAG